MRRSGKSYGLRQGHPEWIGGDIRWGICVFLANPQGNKGDWSGSSSSLVRGEYSLVQILDYRRVTVRALFRGQSWQGFVKSAVFLDSDAHRFGTWHFDCCDVRIPLHNR
jgi:hypothetical protein